MNAKVSPSACDTEADLGVTGADEGPQYRAKNQNRKAENLAAAARRHAERVAKTSIDRDAIKQQQEVFNRRIDAEIAERAADQKLMLQIIDADFKALAMQHHPDKGGSQDGMVRLKRYVGVAP